MALRFCNSARYGTVIRPPNGSNTTSPGAEQRAIPREHVARVELDDDRLVVVLRLTTGEELAIEPVYGGLGLRELGETLQRYLDPSRGHADGDPGCTGLDP